MSTTQVDKKDLPEKQTTFVNAPKDLETAIKRIFDLEMALEDLSRAVEIATYSGQLSIIDSFKRAADQALETKIQIVHKENDFKLTILTDDNDSKDAQT